MNQNRKDKKLQNISPQVMLLKRNLDIFGSAAHKISLNMVNTLFMRPYDEIIIISAI